MDKCNKINNTYLYPWTWVFAVATVFFTLALIGVLHHEPWRDEAYPWLVARDNSNLPNAILESRYTIRPALWGVLLFPLSHLGNPILMQLLSISSATASVLLFMRFVPFGKVSKLLFAFSYYPLFEYGILARDYVIEVLALFLFCLSYQKAKPLWLQCLILALLCNTNCYGLVISLTFYAMLMHQHLSSLSDKPKQPYLLRQAAAGTLIFISALTLALPMVIPPADEVLWTSWYWQINWLKILITLSTIWRGYMPIPQFTLHFWNSNILESVYGGIIWMMLLGVALVIAIACFLRKYHMALFLYLVLTVELLVLTYVKYGYYNRHYGQLFLVFLASVWIGTYAAIKKTKDIRLIPKLIPHSLIVILFAGQLVAGIYAFSTDFDHPFSMGKSVAEFLSSHINTGDSIIIAEPDFLAQAPALYLHRKFFFVRGQRFGTFDHPDSSAYPAIPNPILSTARQLKQKTRHQIFVLYAPHMGLTYKQQAEPIKQKQLWDNNFEVVAKFEGAIERSEEYVLYKLKD